MVHSHWDLEVFARDMQERRMQEADRARQVAVARRGLVSNQGSSSLNVMGRLAETIRAWVSPRPPAVVSDGLGARVPVLAPLAISDDSATIGSLGPHNRSADPYAAMLVIARPVLVKTVEEPCGVREC